MYAAAVAAGGVAVVCSRAAHASSSGAAFRAAHADGAAGCTGKRQLTPHFVIVSRLRSLCCCRCCSLFICRSFSFHYDFLLLQPLALSLPSPSLMPLTPASYPGSLIRTRARAHTSRAPVGRSVCQCSQFPLPPSFLVSQPHLSRQIISRCFSRILDCDLAPER